MFVILRSGISGISYNMQYTRVVCSKYLIHICLCVFCLCVYVVCVFVCVGVCVCVYVCVQRLD